MIFCGAGRTTELRIKLLHNKVDDALSILSGMQQPAHSESEETAKLEKELQEFAEGQLREKMLEILYDFGYAPVGGLYKVPYTGMTEEETAAVICLQLEEDGHEVP
jgi:hypothetical protein